jgi:hypothetical protein
MRVDLVQHALPLARAFAALGEQLCEPLSASNLRSLNQRLTVCISKGP